MTSTKIVPPAQRLYDLNRKFLDTIDDCAVNISAIGRDIAREAPHLMRENPMLFFDMIKRSLTLASRASRCAGSMD